jgi:hypothetical protein
MRPPSTATTAGARALLATEPLAHLLGEPLHALVLLLLPLRQFLQPLERGIGLSLTALLRVLRFALHRLVLIAELVVVQLEQIGEVLGALLSTASAAASTLLLAELHLDVAVHRLGALEALSACCPARALRGPDPSPATPRRGLTTACSSPPGGRTSARARRRVQHLARELGDVLAQPFGDVDHRHVLRRLRALLDRAVAQPVEGARDDVALTRRTVGRVPPPRHHRRPVAPLGVVLPERTHLEEVDVARADIPRRRAQCVIGDEIAGTSFCSSRNIVYAERGSFAPRLPPASATFSSGPPFTW